VHLVSGSCIGSKGLLMTLVLMCCNGGTGQATNHMGLANLGRVALNALTFPVTTTDAKGSLRIMKGFLTPDRRLCLMIDRLGICLQ
jgi:hypothetical protein